MGTYCELYVADYPVLSEKSAVNPLAMTLFRESDKRVYSRRVAERNAFQWGTDWDPNEFETVVEYSAPIANVRDRLRVMGFDIQRARFDFDAAKSDYL